MLEIYRKLRPGEPPTVDSAETLIQNLFFDPRRYDLSTVGRYKFNKKLTLWARVTGQKLAMPVADPAHRRDPLRRGPRPDRRATARELDDHRRRRGLREARRRRRDPRVLQPHGATCSHYVDFDPARSAASTRRVRFPVLQELLEPVRRRGAEGCRVSDHIDDLVPKHIIVRRYLRLHQLSELPGPRRGHHGRYRPPGQPPPALRGRAAAEPVPHRLLPHGARHPRAHDHPGSGHGHARRA